MILILNKPSPEGTELGRNIVRLLEPEIAKAVAGGRPDDRCATCAYRLGTWPNGCATTQMDALKCVMEGVPFKCHERPEKNCWGWVVSVATRSVPKTEVDWPFSDEATPEATQGSTAGK